MDNFSDMIPILIGLIIFIVKIVSDVNKKQKENQSAGKNTAMKRNRTLFDTPEEINQYQRERPAAIPSEYNTTSWESSIERNEFEESKPKYLPQDMPDIDYDKMDNIQLKSDSRNEYLDIAVIIQKPENKKLKDIRKMFREKNSLQELMLLSEVLNKPKAHSRWPRSSH